MIHIFRVEDACLAHEQAAGMVDLIKPDPLWIDIVAPSPEELEWARASLKIDAETPEEAEDIEASARVYEESGNLYLRADFMTGRQQDNQIVPVRFVVIGNQLISLHAEDVPIIRLLRMRARKRPASSWSALGLLIDLFAQDVEYSADVLESIHAELKLGVEPARTDVMQAPPRQTDARILTGARFGRLFVYGFTMAVGTLALFWYARPQDETYALTLAFTAFVLFQFFNVFNARSEHGSAFNRQFFRNRWLWLSLAAVLALQVLVVHWAPAQAVFGTTDLAAADWALAAAVASSVLLLEEARKLALALARRIRSRR